MRHPRERKNATFGGHTPRSGDLRGLFAPCELLLFLYISGTYGRFSPGSLDKINKEIGDKKTEKIPYNIIAVSCDLCFSVGGTNAINALNSFHGP